MKTLKSLLVAGVVLAAPCAAPAQVSAQAWLESYYLNPQPAEVSRALQNLSREGFFDQADNIAVAIGFFATVFAGNPDRVEGWLPTVSRLPARHQRVVAAALWQAGHPLGSDLLRRFAPESPVRAEVLRLADTPAQLVTDTPVRSPSSMRLQWGAFLASGNERHVTRIFDAIGMNEPGLDTAARVSLAQHAAAHPRVLEICSAQLDRQPAEVQSVLRAALHDATAGRGPPRS
jgi:hypothetical protein